MFQLRVANQRNAEGTCGRSVQSVDAVVADGFALTGWCKVVRASLLCRKSSVGLLLVGQRSEHYNYTLCGKPAPRRNNGQRWSCLDRPAIETGQQAFRRSKVAKTLMATSLYLRNETVGAKKRPKLTKTHLRIAIFQNLRLTIRNDGTPFLKFCIHH